MTETMPEDFQWETPPAVTRVRSGAKMGEAVAARLKENPERWARLAVKQHSSTAGNLASRINKGALKAFQPARHFEAMSRMLRDEAGNAILDDAGERQYGVWVRYVGDER